MILALLLTGLSGSFGPPVRLYSELLLCLLATLAIVLLALEERRRSRLSQDGEDTDPTATPVIPVIPMGEQTKKRIRQGAKALALLLIGGAVGGPTGFALGYRQVRADYAEQMAAWKARTDKYQRAYAAWEARQHTSNRQGE